MTLLFLPQWPSISPYLPPQPDSSPGVTLRQIDIFNQTLFVPTLQNCMVVWSFGLLLLLNLFVCCIAHLNSLNTDPPGAARSCKLSHHLGGNTVPAIIAQSLRGNLYFQVRLRTLSTNATPRVITQFWSRKTLI